MIDLPPEAGLVVADAATRLFPCFDWTATVLWAVSGAGLGVRKGYDMLGVFVVALVSATGGGLLRDGLFLQDGPPSLVRTPTYLYLVTIAVLLVLLVGPYLWRRRWFEPLLETVDAIGLGAYAVVGMRLAMDAHLPYAGVMAVGMVNAVGGSVLRDLLTGAPLQLLKPSVWLDVAALSGCVLFTTLVHFKANHDAAGVITVAFVFAIRSLALRFDLKSRPFSAWQPLRKQPPDPGPGE